MIYADICILAKTTDVIVVCPLFYFDLHLFNIKT